MYNRVDNIDDLIGSVKLPYMAWKVLFLVDKKSDSNKIAGLLETEESEVTSSLIKSQDSTLKIVFSD